MRKKRTRQAQQTLKNKDSDITGGGTTAMSMHLVKPDDCCELRSPMLLLLLLLALLLLYPVRLTTPCPPQFLFAFYCRFMRKLCVSYANVSVHNSFSDEGHSSHRDIGVSRILYFSIFFKVYKKKPPYIEPPFSFV